MNELQENQNFSDAVPDEHLPQETADNEHVTPVIYPEIHALEDGGFEISLPELHLEQGGAPLDMVITLQKEITPIQPITALEDEPQAVQEMITAARALRDLPEQERPAKIMKILRERVAYPTRNKIAGLEESDPERANKVKEEFNNPPFIQTTTLRRAVELGCGICGPLSVGMLILGKEAGLDGAFLGNGPKKDDPNPIKNIIRPDNNEPLFTGDQNYGQSIPVAHAWVEFKMSDGTWVPVDPSTKLVGDTEAGMETFRAANYRAGLDATFKTTLTKGLVRGSTRGLEFLPGEDQHIGVLEISPESDDFSGQADITLKSYKAPPVVPMGVRYEVASVSLDNGSAT